MVCVVFFLFTHSIYLIVFFFKQKTAYEVRISDWSSDVCSSDLEVRGVGRAMDRPPGNIAMKQMFRLMPTQTEALRGAVELYLFDDGYAGLQLVEDDIANLCPVIEQ